jgi:hypothetical protein
MEDTINCIKKYSLDMMVMALTSLQNTAKIIHIHLKAFQGSFASSNAAFWQVLKSWWSVHIW